MFYDIASMKSKEEEMGLMFLLFQVMGGRVNLHHMNCSILFAVRLVLGQQIRLYVVAFHFISLDMDLFVTDSYMLRQLQLEEPKVLN